MDQDKFDQHLMDYLFDELDEVTRAAMKRKLESDAQCRKIEAGLRATIEVGQLTLEEAPDDLEDRILGAVEQVQRGEPWHTRLIRFMSWAGSHAMRPQFAMAALLVFLLGSSVLLLRAPGGSVAVTPERDEVSPPAEPAVADPDALNPDGPATPPVAQSAEAEAAEESKVAAKQRAEASSAPQETAAVDAQYDRALNNYNSGNYRDAQRDFAAVNQSGSSKAPSAALYEARAVRSHSGCKDAVRYYSAVRERYGDSAVAADAMWEEADCRFQLGQTEEARQLWLALTKNDDYKSRAVRELASRGEAGTSGKNATSAPRRAAAPAAPPPATKPGSGTSGKNSTSAPDPSPSPYQDNAAY
jgi:hypothetical protein